MVTDVSDLYSGLKDTLIFVACAGKTATLRSKALKSISKVIKVNPESVIDDKIKKVISHASQDSTSVVTREGALDML